MNWICVNCKWVVAERPKKCHNCNGQTFEQTFADPTPSPQAVPVRSLSIKDKITSGEWRSVGSYVRTQGGANGVGYQIGESTINNPHTLGEDEANAKLWAASKEMLDILERLNKWSGYDFAEVTPPESIQDIAHDAQKLLDQLNQ